MSTSEDWARAYRRTATKLESLVDAVSALYYAAHWIPDREVDAPALWEAVRDAAGFTPGRATETLGPPRLGPMERLRDMAPGEIRVAPDMLTVRDRFAMAALVLSANLLGLTDEDIAKDAYQMADAMLQAREGGR